MRDEYTVSYPMQACKPAKPYPRSSVEGALQVLRDGLVFRSHHFRALSAHIFGGKSCTGWKGCRGLAAQTPAKGSFFCFVASGAGFGLEILGIKVSRQADKLTLIYQREKGRELL